MKTKPQSRWGEKAKPRMKPLKLRMNYAETERIRHLNVQRLLDIFFGGLDKAVKKG